MKKVVSFISIITIMAIISVSFATNLYNDKKKISNSINENKKKIERIKNKKAKVEKSILEVAEKKQILIKRIEKTKKDIDSKEKELEIIKQDLEKAIAKIKKQKEDFSARVKAMYKRSQQSTIEVFFKSNGISDFMNKMDYAKRMAKQDDNVLKLFKAEKDKIKKLQEVEKKNLEQLNALKEKQQKSKAELVAVEKELKARAAELQKEIDAEKKKIAQKRAELNSITATIRAYEAKIAAQRAKKSASNANTSRSIPVKYNSKGWVWPLPYTRNITSAFGYRIHPKFGFRKFHSGIDIASYGVHGAPIVAAKGGVVIIARGYGGYGNAVVISHGGGVSTIYAHCSSLLVSPGQVVKAGQVIARVGNTGWSTGAHLHFGVAVNGNWVNPLGFVR